jgi:hypothetical protein
MKKYIENGISFMWGMVYAAVFFAIAQSCTLSFSNVDTHGIAEDLIDENQATTPTITPTISVPSAGPLLADYDRSDICRVTTV